METFEKSNKLYKTRFKSFLISGLSIGILYLFIFFSFGLETEVPYHVDKLDKPFWRSSTMVDRWTNGGGGLIQIPTFIQDSTQVTFYYKKRPYEKEMIFADRVNIVRPLGGWNPDPVAGELNNFTSVEDADIVYRDSLNGNLITRLNLLKDRIDPYYNQGYEESITLVLDNIPYVLPNVITEDLYGQGHPPADMMEWSYLITAMADSLVGWYGLDNVQNWKFRLGTEWGSMPRFTGNNQDYLNLYQTTADALMDVLGAENANLGPFNIAGTKTAPQLANVNFLDVAALAVENDLPFAFNAVSDYSIPSYVDGELNNVNPSQSFNKLMTYWDTVDTIIVAPREIHEYGILRNEFNLRTNEPGARGAARSFDLMLNLWENDVNEIMHWHSSIGDSYTHEGQRLLMSGEGWLLSVLEHLRDTEVFNYNIPENAEGTRPKIMLFEKEDRVYVMASAFNDDRNNFVPQSYCLEIPDSLGIDINEQVLFTTLNAENCLYRTIFNDLDAAGNLNSDYNQAGGLLARLKDMSLDFEQAKEMVLVNYSEYISQMQSLLTLSEYDEPFFLPSTNNITFSIAPSSITVFELKKIASGITTISHFNDELATVFPNPIQNGILKVKFDEVFVHVEQLEIFNVQGERVKKIEKEDAHFHQDVLEVNVADIVPGTYIIRIHTNKDEIEKKIIIQ